MLPANFSECYPAGSRLQTAGATGGASESEQRGPLKAAAFSQSHVPGFAADFKLTSTNEERPFKNG